MATNPPKEDKSVFIPRDFSRTEHDDYALNVQPRIGSDEGATEVFSEDKELMGWVIKPLFE